MNNSTSASDILPLQLSQATDLREATGLHENCQINLNLDHSQEPFTTQPSHHLRPPNSKATRSNTPSSILSIPPLNTSKSTTAFTSHPSTSGRTHTTTPRLDGHNCQNSITPVTSTSQHCMQFQPSSPAGNPSRPPPLQGQLELDSSREQSPPPRAEQVDSPLEQCPGGANMKDTRRNKINIGYIDDARSRQVTFLKRKNGVMKKAMELSILCDCQIAVVVYSKDTSKMFEYSSHDMVQILSRYAGYGGYEDCPSSNTEVDFKPGPSVLESTGEARSTVRTCAGKRRYCDEGDDGRQSQKKPRQARCNVLSPSDVGSPTFDKRSEARNVRDEQDITAGATKEEQMLDWDLDFERQFSDSVRSDGLMSAWMTGDADPPALPSPIVDGERIIDDHVTIPVDGV